MISSLWIWNVISIWDEIVITPRIKIHSFLTLDQGISRNMNRDLFSIRLKIKLGSMDPVGLNPRTLSRCVKSHAEIIGNDLSPLLIVVGFTGL